MDSIVLLDYISAEDSGLLHNLLNQLTLKALSCFTAIDTGTNPQVILHRFVPKWMKFKELLLVLNASLRDIADHWACGKGPLAFEFSPAEMTQLVKALFENTEKRAKVISQITRNVAVWTFSALYIDKNVYNWIKVCKKFCTNIYGCQWCVGMSAIEFF